jgi:TatD DNase family protein
MGFYISFSGIVTFKSAKDLQETCKHIPLDRLLIETDSPYLAPIPYRGKTNEPAWVAKVGEFIANLKNVSINEISEHTSRNFYQCFHIDKELT